MPSIAPIFLAQHGVCDTRVVAWDCSLLVLIALPCSVVGYTPIYLLIPLMMALRAVFGLGLLKTVVPGTFLFLLLSDRFRVKYLGQRSPRLTTLVGTATPEFCANGNSQQW